MGIVGYILPMQDAIEDTVMWNHSSDGRFTVRTAYLVREERGDLDRDPI